MLAAALVILLFLQFIGFSQIVHAAAPDLIILDILATNANVPPGGSTSFIAKLKNAGDAESLPFYMTFSVNGILLSEEDVNDDKGPGSEFWSDDSNSWQYPGGSPLVTVCVDTKSQNSESNEGNNCLTKKFWPGADPPKKEETNLELQVCYPVGSGGCSANTIPANTNVQVEMTGRLEQKNNEDSVDDRLISLTYPGGSTTVTTKENGGFEKVVTVYITSSGTFKATFAGDHFYEGSSATVVVSGTTPPSDPELYSYYLPDIDVRPGDTIAGYYVVDNPNSSPVDVWLGMSIRKDGGSGVAIDDPSRDREVSAPPGLQSFEREFRIPTTAEYGEYSIALAIWEDQPGPGVKQFDTSDWISGKLTIIHDDPPEPFDFSLSLDDSSDTIRVGETATATVTVRLESGDSHSVALSCSGILPIEADCQIEPSIVNPTGTATLTIETKSSTPVKQYAVKITGTTILQGESPVTDSETFMLTVEALPPEMGAEIDGFSIVAREYGIGEYVDAVIDVENTGNVGHTLYVGFSVQDANGKWYDAPYSPLFVATDDSEMTTLRWQVRDDAAIGAYLARVAVYKSISGTLLVTLFDTAEKTNAFTVGDENEFDFSLSLDDYSETIRPGGSVQVELTVNLLSGTPSGVTLSCSILPATASCGVGPSSVIAGEKGKLTVSTSSGTISREYTITVTGSASQKTKDVTFTLSVESDKATAEITYLKVDQKELKKGQAVNPEVGVKSTYAYRANFLAMFSFIDENGKSYGQDDVLAVGLIDSGKTGSIRAEWILPEDAAAGDYDVIATVYQLSNADELSEWSITEEITGAFTVVNVAQRVTGKVVYDERELPLRRAEVRLQLDGSSAGPLITRTSDQGSYTFANVPRTSNSESLNVYTLTVRLDDGEFVRVLDNEGKTFVKEIADFSLTSSSSLGTIYFGCDYDAWDEELCGAARVYESILVAGDFYKNEMEASLKQIDVRLAQEMPSVTTAAYYAAFEDKIYVSEASSYSGSDTLWMEYTHFVQDMENGLPLTPADGLLLPCSLWFEGNHLGFKNDCTADSWIEGLGSFMPSAIKVSKTVSSTGYDIKAAGHYNVGFFNGLNLDKRWQLSDVCPGSENCPEDTAYFDLEGNRLEFQMEDIAVASMLWDLYTADEEGATPFSAKEIWDIATAKEKLPDYVLKALTSVESTRERHIIYLKDLYDLLHLDKYSKNEISYIESVFEKHGARGGVTDVARPNRI